jgi:hypothetical protein
MMVMRITKYIKIKTVFENASDVLSCDENPTQKFFINYNFFCWRQYMQVFFRTNN